MNLRTTTQTERSTPKRSLLYVGFTIVSAVAGLIGCIQPQGDSPEVDYVGPVLGVVVDENMKVVGIQPQSAAEKAGIQIGDVLMGVDSVPFTEKEKARALLSESPGEAAYEAVAKGGEWQGKTRRLQLQRNGQEMELEVIPEPPIFAPGPTVTSVWPPLDFF